MNWRTKRIIKEGLITISEISMATLSAYIAFNTNEALGALFSFFAISFAGFSIYEFWILITDINNN